MIAVAAAALAAYAIGAALAGRTGWVWLLLCVPVVIGAAVPRARQALLAAKVTSLAGAWRRDWSQWRRLRPAGHRRAQAPPRLIRRRLRAGSRRLLRVLVIAGASAALSLQLAARWALAGADTSWTQRRVTGAGALVDGAAVLVAARAAFKVADLDWVALRGLLPLAPPRRSAMIELPHSGTQVSGSEVLICLVEGGCRWSARTRLRGCRRTTRG